MGRKTDAETLKALEAKKTELEEKIRKKKAVIQEKIRTEEARKKDAEKRRLEHVKFLLGGFFLNFISREVIRLALENKIGFTEEGSISAVERVLVRIYKRYHLKFDNEKDREAVQNGLAMQVLKEIQSYLSSPEAYLASLGEKPDGGEAVSPSHEK